MIRFSEVCLYFSPRPTLGSMPTFWSKAIIQLMHLHLAHAPVFGYYACIRLLHIYSAHSPAFKCYVCIRLLCLYSANSHAFNDYVCIWLIRLFSFVTYVFSYYVYIWLICLLLAFMPIFGCHTCIRLLPLQTAVYLHLATSHSTVSHSVVGSFSSKSSVTQPFATSQCHYSVVFHYTALFYSTFCHCIMSLLSCLPLYNIMLLDRLTLHNVTTRLFVII